MRKEKVFCKGCKWVFGEVACTHPSNMTYKDTPYENKAIKWASLSEANGANDCQKRAGK